MATNAVVPQAGPRVRAQGVIVLAFGVALLAGAAAATYVSRDDSQLRAYNSAPSCASLDDAIAGKACRYTTTAFVTGSGGGNNANADVYFRLSGTYFDATVPNADVSIAVGSQVPVEIWAGRVTKIAKLTTTANPVNDPRPGTLREIAALLAMLGMGSLLMARRLWRDDRGWPSMAAAMTPVAASDLMTH
jgi:hypothetical protein